ncbi:MAG: hypothetical protein HOH66_12265 [Rhodospirillaceae bacterium]|jgi:serine/threonine protein phosphatase 1|nr:hypothetical protein [Rhodospirillaceae bacterium]MBT6118632.1 hypothetical protein [Rhodospirillaceae bacterium]
MARPPKIATLRMPCRVWAVASLFGDAARVDRLHAQLDERMEPTDRVVYLGNVLGGRDGHRAVDRLLAFEKRFLARPGIERGDLVWLRGAQEEMLQKLFQIQMAVEPERVLEWMVAWGADRTIQAYGADANDAFAAIRQGTMAITHWTIALRKSFQEMGHQRYFNALQHAARMGASGYLFVNAGLDPQRPLDEQGDSFWWDSGAFERLEEPFAGFARVVRGYDPEARGLVEGEAWISLDGGSGRGGPLLAACFAEAEGIVDRIEV